MVTLPEGWVIVMSPGTSISTWSLGPGRVLPLQLVGLFQIRSPAPPSQVISESTTRSSSGSRRRSCRACDAPQIYVIVDSIVESLMIGSNGRVTSLQSPFASFSGHFPTRRPPRGLLACVVIPSRVLVNAHRRDNAPHPVLSSDWVRAAEHHSLWVFRSQFVSLGKTRAVPWQEVPKERQTSCIASTTKSGRRSASGRAFLVQKALSFAGMLDSSLAGPC